MSYHFGIIGLGMIAEMHAQAISALDNGVLAACFDVNDERTARFRDQFGGSPYTSLDAFLAHPDLDIVTICTPSSLHLESALKAAQAGKHLIVEKPLEITIERCDQIIQAATANNVMLAGIFPSRFYEPALLVKKAIERERFGRIVLADAYVKWHRDQAYYDSSDWKGTWAYDGGGALMNQSIHAIDLLQWFMGPVSKIWSFSGTLSHERIEVEDTAVASLQFENGALGVIEGTTGAFPGFPKKIEISGSQGSVVLEEGNLTAWNFAKETPEDEAIRAAFINRAKSAGGASDPAAIGFLGHQLQFADMLEALDQNRRPLVDGQEARKAVEIIQAIYESARTGRPVNLPL